MKKILFLVFAYCSLVQAQNVTINPTGITPAPAATYPRISYDDILVLPSPIEGDQAYDLTFHCMRVFNGSQWVSTSQIPALPVTDMAALASAGSSSNDEGTSVAVDAAGNVYICGNFSGTASFGATNIVSLGNSDIFVAKYNSSGVLQWVQSAGSSDNDYAQAVAVDTAGNVFITGNYQDMATFGATNINSVGAADIFVAKYNSNGALQWVQSAGSVDNDFGQSIAVDIAGNVYLCGEYFDDATFGTVNVTNTGMSDIFVAKYNSSGSVQWVQPAGSDSEDSGFSVTVDVSGNVYISGSFMNTATFGTSTITSLGNADIFVAKYNNTGTLQWVKSAGSTSFNYARSVAVDAAGNVYICGDYSDMATFETTTITSKGDYDVYIAKYNSGGTLQWVQSAGGTSYETGTSIAVDGTGNVYMSGTYQGTPSFGTRSITSLGGESIFAAKYNSNGILRWLNSAGGSSTDSGKAIATDSSGNIYLVGSYQGTATFGTTNRTSAGSSDIFLARIRQ